MTEQIKKAGKSQYGHYLQKADGSYVGCSEAVNKFLASQLPAEVEFTETEGEGKKLKVNKVKVISAAKPTKSNDSSQGKKASMIVSYAKDLAVAEIQAVQDKCKTLEELNNAIKGIVERMLINANAMMNSCISLEALEK